jgi:hypothetical protein
LLSYSGVEVICDQVLVRKFGSNVFPTVDMCFQHLVRVCIAMECDFEPGEPSDVVLVDR